MRVGIVGAGAIGTLLGASLAPGVDVAVLVRTAREARAIADRGGLVLDGAPPRPVRVSADPDVLARSEFVLVALKSYATVAALAPLRGTQLAERAAFVSFANGLDAVAQLEFALGHRCAVALGPTTEGVQRLEPGIARRTGAGVTRIGWDRAHARPSEALVPLASALGAGLAVETVEAIEPFVWAKLVANAAINPLTALARVPNGALLADAALRARAARIAREVAAVAARRSIVLPFADPVAYAEGVAAATAGNRSSMLSDLEAGRPTEIESITGALVRSAAEVGVDVPENARVLAAMRAAA